MTNHIPDDRDAEVLARAVSAYNEVWESSGEIDSSNVDEVRQQAIAAALRSAALLKQSDPSREELINRLQRAVDRAGDDWAYRPLIVDAIAVLRLAAKPVDDGVRKAAFLECAAMAKEGAKQCSEGDSTWHQGFKYAANATALDIADRITLAALSPPSPGERK